MSSLVAESSARPALVPGKKYRFFARSAEEAVQIIHDRMGPQGRVVAVEQVGGQGLSRLLRSPKLEVIAMIPEASAGDRRPADRPAPKSPASDPVAAEPAAQAASAARTTARGDSVPVRPPPASPAAAYARVQESTAHPAVPPPTEEEAPLLQGSRDLRSILRRLGFSAPLLGQFAASVDPQELGRTGWANKLDRFIEFLWQRYQELPSRPLAGQVAFFGTPGAGITTALCKELTASVFLRGEQPLVSCLEHDRPSSTESLSAFCELMQVPLVTEERGVMAPTERVFWDIPGISSRDFDTWDEVGARLDELLIQTRVFVTHAAFDSQHLVQLLRTVEAVRPTHLVLTHLDEATQPARLWDFLQSAGLCPLFASESPSVTGGRRDDFHAALLAQTFPTHLNAKAS